MNQTIIITDQTTENQLTAIIAGLVAYRDSTFGAIKPVSFKDFIVQPEPILPLGTLTLEALSGCSIQPMTETCHTVTELPKRFRRTKAEMESARDEQKPKRKYQKSRT